MRQNPSYLLQIMAGWQMSDSSYPKYNPQEKYKNYREDFSLLPKRTYNRSLIGSYLVGYILILLAIFYLKSFTGDHWLAFLGLSILTLTVVLFKVRKNKTSFCPQCNQSMSASYDHWTVCKNCEVKYYDNALGNFIIRTDKELIDNCQVPFPMRNISLFSPHALLFYLMIYTLPIKNPFQDKTSGQEFLSNSFQLSESLIYGGLICLFAGLLWGSLKLAKITSNGKSINISCPQCGRNMELFNSDREPQYAAFAAVCSCCNVKVYLNQNLKKVTQFPDKLMTAFKKSSQLKKQIEKLTFQKVLLSLFLILLFLGIPWGALHVLMIVKELIPNIRCCLLTFSYGVFLVLTIGFLGMTYQFVMDWIEKRYKCSACKSPLKIYHDKSTNSNFIACEQCQVAGKKYFC